MTNRYTSGALQALVAAAGVAWSVPICAAVPPVTLDPSRGSETGASYQSWLSPHQEGGEEADTPKAIPKSFRSTTPSVPRNQRKSAGHGVLQFSRDLSRAYVEVRIEGVDPQTINMFHIHCGKPGILGPILIDFAIRQDLKQAFADGVLTAEIRNEDIVAVSQHSHDGVVAFATAGCPINKEGSAFDRVKTVAGMAAIAREGELYFNLHTTGQSFFGDIRGQLEAMPNQP